MRHLLRKRGGGAWQISRGAECCAAPWRNSELRHAGSSQRQRVRTKECASTHGSAPWAPRVSQQPSPALAIDGAHAFIVEAVGHRPAEVVEDFGAGDIHNAQAPYAGTVQAREVHGLDLHGVPLQGAGVIVNQACPGEQGLGGTIRVVAQQIAKSRTADAGSSVKGAGAGHTVLLHEAYVLFGCFAFTSVSQVL